MEALGERLGQLLRALGAAARWLAPRALWLLRAVAALGWMVVYALVRLLQASKRAWVCSAVLLLLSVAGFVHEARALANPPLVVAVLALALVVTQRKWRKAAKYREQLRFDARSQLGARQLHTGCPWGEGCSLRETRTWLGLVGALAALVLAAALWRQSNAAVHTLVLAAACALLALASGCLTFVLLQVERGETVRFYLRGPRLGDPVGWEGELASWLPGWAPFVGWRARVGGVLAPLTVALGSLVTTRESCQG